MRKEGFVLVELIAAIGVLLIIFASAGKGINYYIDYKNQLEAEGFIYEVKDFFCYSRQYCICNNVPGEIVIRNNDGDLVLDLECNSNLVQELKLSNALRLKDYNNGEKISKIVIKVNIEGYIEAKTIRFIDKNNCLYNFIIQVGGNLIKINRERG